MITMTLTTLGQLSRANGWTNASAYAMEVSRRGADLRIRYSDGRIVLFLNGRYRGGYYPQMIMANWR